jgi:hypothetical protein
LRSVRRPSGFVIRRSLFDILLGFAGQPFRIHYSAFVIRYSPWVWLFGVPCLLFSVAVAAPAQGRQEIRITPPEIQASLLFNSHHRNGQRQAKAKEDQEE